MSSTYCSDFKNSLQTPRVQKVQSKVSSLNMLSVQIYPLNVPSFTLLLWLILVILLSLAFSCLMVLKYSNFKPVQFNLDRCLN